ncbi:hypothetical protein [Haladaptatus sp. ZSTT2]
MTELEDAVSEFLRNAKSVYNEYERGYTDADAALSVLEMRIEELRDEFEN